MVNGDPLKFYHFTGYDSGAGLKMSSRFFKEMPQLEELWRDYALALKANGQETVGKMKWKYLCFDNGEKISDAMRYLYRDREDLKKAFENPFKSDGYLAWYKANVGLTDDDFDRSICDGQSKVHFRDVKQLFVLYFKQKWKKYKVNRKLKALRE